MAETLEEWVVEGIEKGWASDTFCLTHESTPLNQTERAAFEEGWDPCIEGVRIWWDPRMGPRPWEMR